MNDAGVYHWKATNHTSGETILIQRDNSSGIHRVFFRNKLLKDDLTSEAAKSIYEDMIEMWRVKIRGSKGMR
jgi:hypothetical protein